MLTQRQMRRSKREADIDNSIIKREGMKESYVTFVKCGCGAGLHSMIRHHAGLHRLLTWDEYVNQMRSKDLKKRQDARRKQGDRYAQN